ncbi:MAG: Maf family protein [Bacteroides sp.]|nr:Maf family protein [Bacteroides sp.]
MKLILASGSPRRRELLKLIREDFEVIPADCAEDLDTALDPAEAVKALAVRKAEHISAKYPDKAVIGADTMVFYGNTPLGKPKDAADAAGMLSLLSGKKHTVITAVAAAVGGRTRLSFSQETRVEFYPLSESEIREYIKTGEPMDKAGAYGIQEKGALLVKGIEGDYYTVMGLPVAELYRRLKELDII